MSGRVFVVQNQHRLDRATGTLVPKFDLSSAESYGELTFLLSPTASPFRSEAIIEELRDKLADFDDGDRLLLVGNPILIGLASAVASGANRGNVGLLQWSGREQRYLEVLAKDLFL